MTTYLQLTGHIVEQLPADGIRVNNLLGTVTLGNGSSVQFALPFMEIGNGLVVVPFVSPEGETSIRVDLGCWTPGYLNGDFGTVLPFSTGDQALAVRVCRAFHAAPETSWTDSRDTVLAWLDSWIQANDIGVNA